MGASRASVTAVAAVVGGVLLMTLLVTWAASIGPSDVLTGDGVDPVRLTPSETETSLDPLERLQDRQNRARAGARSAGRVRVVARSSLEVLAGIVLLYLLYRAGALGLPDVAGATTARPDAAPEVDFDAPGPAGAGRRESWSRTPPPSARSCWAGRRATPWSRPGTGSRRRPATAGVRRQPWETSSEFTLRVLDLVTPTRTPWRGSPPSTARRASPTTRIGEADRAAALAALDAIHASLRSSARRAAP